MTKIKQEDVRGLRAFNKYAEQFPDESPEFDKKFQELFTRYGIDAQLDFSFGAAKRQKLKSEAWFFIRDEIFPVIDPNNKRDAYFLCQALTHFAGDIEYDKDSPFHFLLFTEEKGIFGGLASHAFQKTLERFEGTALGDFADYAVNTTDRLDHLVFSFSG